MLMVCSSSRASLLSSMSMSIRFTAVLENPLLLDLICTYLAKKDLVVCTQVSRVWFQLFQPVLWRTLRVIGKMDHRSSLNLFQDYPEYCDALLKNGPLVKALHLLAYPPYTSFFCEGAGNKPGRGGAADDTLHEKLHGAGLILKSDAAAYYRTQSMNKGHVHGDGKTVATTTFRQWLTSTLWPKPMPTLSSVPPNVPDPECVPLERQEICTHLRELNVVLSPDLGKGWLAAECELVLRMVERTKHQQDRQQHSSYFHSILAQLSPNHSPPRNLRLQELRVLNLSNFPFRTHPTLFKYLVKALDDHMGLRELALISPRQLRPKPSQFFDLLKHLPPGLASFQMEWWSQCGYWCPYQRPIVNVQLEDKDELQLLFGTGATTTLKEVEERESLEACWRVYPSLRHLHMKGLFNGIEDKVLANFLKMACPNLMRVTCEGLQQDRRSIIKDVLSQHCRNLEAHQDIIK